MAKTIGVWMRETRPPSRLLREMYDGSDQETVTRGRRRGTGEHLTGDDPYTARSSNHNSYGSDDDEGPEEGDLRRVDEDDDDGAAERLSRALAVLQDPDLSADEKVKQLSRLLGASAPAVESLRRGRPRNAVALLESAIRRVGRKDLNEIEDWSTADFVGFLRGVKSRR
jgi:hypothetical protein